MYNLAEQKLEHTNLHEIALHEDSFSLTVNTGWHCRLRAWENGALDTNCRQMWLTTVGLPAGTPTEWSLWISVRRWQTECLTYSNLQHHVAAVTVKIMNRLRSCRGGGSWEALDADAAVFRTGRKTTDVGRPALPWPHAGYFHPLRTWGILTGLLQAKLKK